MTAAAAAAKTSVAVVGEGPRGRDAILAVALVSSAGLVEGAALGAFQSSGLSRRVPGLDRRRFLLGTLAVAGLGWAAASVPGVLAAPAEGSDPPLALLLAGALGLGVVMGALLGAVQATVLRGRVRHAARWVLASALAWGPAMVVVFAGATLPAADWSVVAVTGLGTATGLLAGAVLGLVSGVFLPSLDGPPVRDRVVVRTLGSPLHRLLDGSLLALRVRGRVTGRSFELPVQYAVDADGLVVVPGRSETKTWWRNLIRPGPVEVLLDGSWSPGDGRVLRPGDAGYRAARRTYALRWPRVPLPESAPLVRVRTGAGRLPEQVARASLPVALPAWDGDL